jgi:hypothetical protein
MAIPIELIQDILERSLAEFFRREANNLVNGVNERNSCGRLATYMQQIATGSGLGHYFADNEFNRKQGRQIKTILGKDMKVVTINCDLILHSRGESIAEDNLIAIEMKKAGRPTREKTADRLRLCAMTKSSYDGVWSNDGTAHPEHVCGYRIGAYVELNNTTRKARVEYFMKGKRVASTLRSY